MYIYVYSHLHYNESICWSSTTISSPPLTSLFLTFKLIIQRQRADSWYRITEITIPIQSLCQKDIIQMSSFIFIIYHSFPKITVLLWVRSIYYFRPRYQYYFSIYVSCYKPVVWLGAALDCGKRSQRNKLLLDFTITQLQLQIVLSLHWISLMIYTCIRLFLDLY